MNILIVSHFDPAGLGIKQKKTIEKHTNHNCRLICLTAHPFGYEYDILIDELNDFEEVTHLVKEADVIQFMITDWEDTVPFGPIEWADWVEGKRICILLPGEPFILNPVPQAEKYLKYNVRTIPTWNRVADDLHETLYQPLPTPMPSLLNDPYYKDLFQPIEKPNERVVVTHFPSADIRKGSFLFDRVMEDIIKTHRNVHCSTIRGQSHRDAMRIMWESDIVFDEIWIEGLWGQTTIEAISMGKVALAWLPEKTISWWNKACGCDHMPIVNVDPENLKETLIQLVTDSNLREERGRQGRQWFEKYWDSPRTVGKIIEFYDNLPIFHYDRQPEHNCLV